MAWLLAVLFASRALIPVGFMIALDAPGVPIALCPVYAAVPAPAAARTPAAHVHHHVHAADAASASGDAPSAPATTSSGIKMPRGDAHGICAATVGVVLGLGLALVLLLVTDAARHLPMPRPPVLARCRRSALPILGPRGPPLAFR